jgi:hypothetical protein
MYLDPRWLLVLVEYLPVGARSVLPILHSYINGLKNVARRILNDFV